MDEGYTVKIHKADGTTEVQEMTLGAVTIRFASNCQTVNQIMKGTL